MASFNDLKVNAQFSKPLKHTDWWKGISFSKSTSQPVRLIFTDLGLFEHDSIYQMITI